MLNDYDIEVVRRFSKNYLNIDIDKEILDNKYQWIHKYQFAELSIAPSECDHDKTHLDITFYIDYDYNNYTKNRGDTIQLDGYFLCDSFDITKFYKWLAVYNETWLTGEQLVSVILRALFDGITLCSLAYHKMMEECSNGKHE